MKNFKKFLSNIYISKTKTKLINKKGFTLVELIIVITILALLWTIAFSSYRGITESARDSNRLATLKELEKGLDLYKVQTGNYPMPEGQIHTGVLSLSGILSISGVLSLSGKIDYSYMGIVGENVSNQLKLNSVPLDPLSNANYVYATNTNRTTYQIATVFERLEAYKKPGQNMPIPGQNMKFNIFDKQELCLIQETYANDSSYKAKVLGNHKTEVKKEYENKVFLMTVPSMIFDPNYSNILNNSSGSYLIVNKGKNLPYKLNSNDTTANQKGDEIMQVLRENTKAKIVSIDITEIVNASNSSDRITKINALFGTGQTDASKELLSSFGVKEADLGNTSAITSKMETIITGQTITSQSKIPSTPTNASCTLSGQTINHGSSITTYNETSILWNAAYNCDNRKITRTCNDGVLSGDSNYIYTSCVKGVVNNCSASGSYVYNTHTYNIPAINHNTSTGNILSSIVNENNGQFKYTLINIECNDGNYANITEDATGAVISCDENYTSNGTACTDQTPPTGGNFTINNDATTTNTTAVTLNITCPTDALNSTPIQVAYGNTASPNSNWQNCTTGNYNHNLDVGDGSKTIYVRFKDNVGNITIDTTKNITLNTTVSGTCSGIIENAVYYNNTASYSLSGALNGTSLTAGYNSNPTENTCQYKCATDYTWGGSSCIANNIVLYDNSRRWSDGNYAISCDKYKNPTGIYEYNGNIGDGIYWIKPDSNPAFKIYCDMTTDGGGWTLAFKITNGTMGASCYNNINGCNINNLLNKNFDSSGRLSNSILNNLSSRVGKIIRSDRTTTNWYIRTSGKTWPSSLQMVSGGSCLNNFLCTVYSNYSDAVSDVNSTIVGGYFDGTQYYPTAYGNFGQRFGYSTYELENGMRFEIGGNGISNQSGIIWLK